LPSSFENIVPSPSNPEPVRRDATNLIERSRPDTNPGGIGAGGGTRTPTTFAAGT
jgi:hypothetical protein